MNLRTQRLAGRRLQGRYLVCLPDQAYSKASAVTVPSLALSLR